MSKRAIIRPDRDELNELVENSKSVLNLAGVKSGTLFALSRLEPQLPHCRPEANTEA